jgi:hypothetical protein
MTCNHDNLVRFRVEALKFFIMNIFIGYYLICLLYCFFQLGVKYKREYNDGQIGLSPGLDVLMVVILSWLLAPIDVVLTWIRMVRESEKRKNNDEKIL